MAQINRTVFIERDSRALTSRVVEALGGYDDVAQAAANASAAAAQAATASGAAATAASEAEAAASAAEAWAQDVVPSIAILRSSARPYDVGTIIFARRESASFEVVGSDPDLTTAGGVMLRALGAILRPEQFGYMSGQGDCSDILNRMFSRGREFGFDPNETYQIGGQIDTGARAIFHGGIVRFEVIASMTTAAVVLRDTQADTVEIHVGTGISCPVASIIRNGFSNIEALRITSDDQQVSYSGASAAAVRFDETDGMLCYPRVGTLYARGFDRVAWGHLSIDSLSIDWLDIEGCYRGLQTDPLPNLRLGGGTIHCDSPNSAPDPGHNGLVIHADQATIGDFYVYDSGEHGYRFVAGNADLGETGGNYTCGNLVAIRPGRCGVKFASGTATGTPANIEIVEIASIYVEDAGTFYDPDPGAASWTDDNDHALSLLNCKKVTIGRFVTRKASNNWNGRFGIKLDGVQFLTIESADIADTFSEAIHLDDDWISLDTINMPDVTIRNCGLGGAGVPAIRFNSIQRAARHITLSGYVNACTGILQIATGTGSFAQECFFNFRHRDITGNLYTGSNYSNIFMDFASISTPRASVYVGGDSANEAYPVGTVLVANVPGGSSMPSRNAVMAPHRHTNGTGFSINASNSVGSQLQGEWRARGSIGTDHVQIQRVW